MQALDGIRVIDLSRYISGPYCGELLGDMGAEVIKVETPDGEPNRHFEPSINGFGFYNMVMNRNKKSITLQFRSEEAKEILTRLFQDADVIIQNFKPGTFEKMGFNWDTIHQLNPRAILVSISGFGQNGPMAGYPGFDYILQAMGGLMNMTGSPEGEPYLAGSFVIDYITAAYAAFATSMALIAREKTGVGQKVEASLLNSAMSILVDAVPEDIVLHKTRTRTGNLDKNTAPVGCFKAKDDYVYVIAAMQSHWERLAEHIGRKDLISDPRFLTNNDRFKHYTEVNAYVQEWVQTKNREDIVNELNALGIPSAPVLSISDFIRLPQVQSNNQIIEVPVKGIGKIPVQGFPVDLSDTPPALTLGPPNLGEHNEEIYQQLGFSEAEIQRMKEKNVI